MRNLVFYRRAVVPTNNNNPEDPTPEIPLNLMPVKRNSVLQTAKEPETKKIEIPKSPMHDRMIEFLKNETFADVTLKIDGVELKAHKIILAAMSPVFSVMFENTMMREARENYVIIEDINIDVAQQMLEYIYSNERPTKLDEFLIELMAVAQKYQMERLKAMCQESIANKLSTSNAINILAHADFYEAKELKKRVINFIKSHKHLQTSQDFRELEETNPKLFIEVLKKLLLIANSEDEIIEIFD